MLWNELKYDLKKKHKKECQRDSIVEGIAKIMDSKKAFIKTIEHSYPYVYLFPHIYNKPTDYSGKVKQTLSITLFTTKYINHWAIGA